MSGIGAIGWPSADGDRCTAKQQSVQPEWAALQECERTIRQHSKSFALAARLLPKQSRNAAVVVYTWCRRADDAIDLAPPEQQEAALEQLRRDLHDVYGSEDLQDPVLVAFRSVVRHFGVPIEYPSELLAGMGMDVSNQRYETMEQLNLYCYRVAGTVGLMMAHVLGVSRDAALRHAAHLGMAMQLTNICRDVAEDWDRGRLYLPREIFADGYADMLVPGGAPISRDWAGAMELPLQRLLGDARALYQSGDVGLRMLSWRSAFGVRTARRVYSAIGDRLAEQGYDVLAGRAVVGSTAKLGLVILVLLEMLADLPRRYSSRFERAPIRSTMRYPDDIVRS